MSQNAFYAGLKVCPTTPAKDMAAFDALPPLVRARLRDAPCNVASEPLLRFWTSNVGDASSRHDALIEGLDRRLASVSNEVRA